MSAATLFILKVLLTKCLEQHARAHSIHRHEPAQQRPFSTGSNGSIPGVDRIGQQAANSGTSINWNAFHEAVVQVPKSRDHKSGLGICLNSRLAWIISSVWMAPDEQKARMSLRLDLLGWLRPLCHIVPKN